PVTEYEDETEEEESTRTDDDVTFLDMSEILSAENEVDGQLCLPPHHRCASHTSNIISTSDVEKYLTFHAESKAVYRSNTAKCTVLWTKSSRVLREYQFLHEYRTFMKSLTAALDILQGDCPYGTLLPTLKVLMQKTLAVKDSLSRMTAGLPDTIVRVCSTSKLLKISYITQFLYIEQYIQYRGKKD
ncbi:hypothetical protein GOODEAATRI_008047, partial [Goodea atripinnis]